MSAAVAGILLASYLGASVAAPAAPPSVAKAEPITIGETFTIESKVLHETRRINVFLPPVYQESPATSFPVIYMPDGGIGEDFLHVAGLVQVSVRNGTMRPFLLVGIENTERRRDMTGPTKNTEDRKIAPVVGGSAAFREFLRNELMPEVRRRYRTTDETAIVGESLAGLFVVETLFLERDLFDTYIAIDPSLWWNGQDLVNSAAVRLASPAPSTVTLYLATSDEPGIVKPVQAFVATLRKSAPPTLRWSYAAMPGEHHGTIYHPAALWAFRSVFAPAPAPTH
ncbi:MAG TPA: alpha/beta hydrolase-fold protein [Thermoanaerobaculia bacterium]|nr:alpha/beta hydrolase-fold protein [Thermoanaerobaculia bacterium]